MASPSLAPTAQNGVVENPQNEVVNSSSSPKIVQNQSRLRWVNQLSQKIKKTAFSIEENDAIIRNQKALGNKWSQIAKYLPGRTDNSIKNQWKVLMSMKGKDVRAYNRLVSLDSADNSSGSNITNLLGKSTVVNEDTSVSCLNKPPSPSDVIVASSGGYIAGTSTLIPSGVVAPPAEPKFIDFLGVGEQ
ncbi:homeodomain-like protein [Artemisia annua]|uniref:Homeodomain-like protein n=1 Tax=Artemisia annua TaxID=35608 RepID=A0A2U1NY91_ARTAN|nr:homeodomain-like protein [Artemisia annua]